MTKCYRCKNNLIRLDLIGVNIFDASTGTHIATRWYCHFCASVLGLIKHELYPQATTNGDAL